VRKVRSLVMDERERGRVERRQKMMRSEGTRRNEMGKVAEKRDDKSDRVSPLSRLKVNWLVDLKFALVVPI